MKAIIRIVAVLCVVSALFFALTAYALTADEIIKKVDRNQVFDSQKGRAVMIIERDGKKIVKEMKSYGVKEGNKFFVEFLNPEDKGVKYLKINNELWIYLPDADDVMKISGHMLRQGMMGSDISYEDLLSDDELQNQYKSSLVGDTNLNGVLCYDVELVATKEDVTYYKRRLLVDKERMVALQFDLFAKSGRLLKTFSQSGIEKYGDRYFPTKMVIRDMKRKDSLTSFEYKDLEFDVPMPKGIFSKQSLKK